MQNLEHFAQSPQESAGKARNNTAIAPEIIKYLEDESDFRQFFVIKPMSGVLSKSFRIEKEEGIAVQIAGNSEVPRAEDVERLFTIFLQRIGTGYKITDDDRKINADDAGYESRKMAAALRRISKKENLDMANVFMAAPQAKLDVASISDFNVDAVKDAVTTMVTTQDDNIVMEPDTIFMSYKVFRQLTADPEFHFVPEIYAQILLQGTPNGAKASSKSGATGQYVDGLEIFIMNELGNNVILLDSTKEALWLAQDSKPTITKYRDAEHISDITDIRVDLQPVCVRPEALFKIEIGS